jgi:hypothetical protein
MYQSIMPFKKRLTEDTETLSGRVLKGIPEKFRNSISPREKAIDHLSAALMLWMELDPDLKKHLLEALDSDPQTPVAEKVARFYQGAGLVDEEAQSVSRPQKRRQTG